MGISSYYLLLNDVLLRESCGVFGVFGHPEAARLTYYGLYALQHRGQESAGIVVSNGKQIKDKRAMGLVNNIFREYNLAKLTGHIACGHVRYSTTGSSIFRNIQPLIINYAGHSFCLAHNGNLTNAYEIRSRLERDGSIFYTSMDSEIVMHLFRRYANAGVEQGIISTLKELRGAYCFLFMTEDTLIAARDPYGFHPLCLGILDDAYVLASETCALDLIEARFLREIEAGEVVFINDNGLRAIKPFDIQRKAHCIFEFIYFARPDSEIFGQNVYQVRKRQGVQLYKEHPNISADFVMPFPDSGNYAALGYASASGLPFEIAMIRNHYVGRTFIQPSQDMRDFGVRVKLNPVRKLIRGKKIIIVEDSIIRGTTTIARIKNIRDAEAAEVHMLVSCPPHRYPCYYGIDFSTKGELIASNRREDEIREILGLDSLHYLSIEGLLASTKATVDNFCLACFDGKYPVPIDFTVNKFCFER